MQNIWFKQRGLNKENTTSSDLQSLKSTYIQLIIFLWKKYSDKISFFTIFTRVFYFDWEILISQIILETTRKTIVKGDFWHLGVHEALPAYDLYLAYT